MRYLLLAALMATIPSAALFAETDSADDRLFDLGLSELAAVEVIDSAAKHEQLLEAVPGSATVVTRDEIRAYGYRTLAELLQAEDGFSTAYDRNYTYAPVRGVSPLTNNRILVLVNGHRVNENFYEQAWLGTAFPVDLDMVERVEIVRGPNSALYGTNAMMAIVNVVTRKPEPGFSVEAAALGGSQSTARFRGTLSGGDYDRGRWLVSGSFFRTDGESRLFYEEYNDPATNNGIYRDNDGDEAYRFLGHFTRGGLTVNAFASSREKRIPTGSYATLFDAPGTFSRDQLAHVDVIYRSRLAEKLDYFSTVFYDRFFYTGDYVYDYPPVTVNRDEVTVHTLGTEQRLGWSQGIHRLLVGFELRNDLRFEATNFDVEPRVTYVDNSGDDQTLGVFAQDELTLSRHWQMTVGARYDEYFGRGGSFNPRLGVVYSLRQQTRLKLLAGRAYRAPNKTELEDAGPWRENVGVGPESLQSYEFVWDEILSPEIRIRTSIYHNIISDLIVFGATSSSGQGFFNQSGDVGISGGEFSIDYGATRGWRAHAGASYADLNGDDTAVSVNSPRWMFKVRAASPLLAGSWRLGVQGMRLGSRLSFQGAHVAAYHLLNANLQYLGLASSGWRFALGARNLLDAEYSDPATEVHLQESLPQDPLVVFFQATFTR